MTALMTDEEVIERVLDHAANGTTDLGPDVWQEPVENYRSQERFELEIELFKRLPMVYCPSAGLAKAGDYVARSLAGVPLLSVRGDDGIVRTFHSALFDAASHNAQCSSRWSVATRPENCEWPERESSPSQMPR